MSDTLTIPETGLHYGVPFDEYLAWDAVSHTDLKTIADSPARYQWRKDHPPKTTDDQRCGTMCHTAVLEPHLFDSQYMAREKPDRRTKAGKATWLGYQAEAEASGKVVITLDDYDLAMRTRDAVRAHPAARELLEVEGDAEVSMRWRMSDLDCKGRVDWLPKSLPFIVDLKTTRSASPYGFQRSIVKYGYQVQAWFYTDGYHLATTEGLTTDFREFRIIAVEKHPPYLVSVFSLDHDAMTAGMEIACKAIDTYNYCSAIDRWPGYSDELLILSLPEILKMATEGGEDDDPGF